MKKDKKKYWLLVCELKTDGLLWGHCCCKALLNIMNIWDIIKFSPTKIKLHSSLQRVDLLCKLDT